MLPLLKDLYVFQGSDFSAILPFLDAEGDPFDLSGYDMSIVIKKYYNTSTIYPATCEIESLEEGSVKITIPAETTSIMDSARYVYSLSFIQNGIKMTAAYGHILVSRF